MHLCVPFKPGTESGSEDPTPASRPLSADPFQPAPAIPRGEGEGWWRRLYRGVRLRRKKSTRTIGRSSKSIGQNPPVYFCWNVFWFASNIGNNSVLKVPLWECGLFVCLFVCLLIASVVPPWEKNFRANSTY